MILQNPVILPSFWPDTGSMGALTFEIFMGRSYITRIYGVYIQPLSLMVLPVAVAEALLIKSNNLSEALGFNQVFLFGMPQQKKTKIE